MSSLGRMIGLFPRCLSRTTPYTSGSLVELRRLGQNLPSCSIRIRSPSLRSCAFSWEDSTAKSVSSLLRLLELPSFLEFFCRANLDFFRLCFFRRSSVSKREALLYSASLDSYLNSSSCGSFLYPSSSESLSTDKQSRRDSLDDGYRKDPHDEEFR
jgi:hypothetical protein